MIGTIVASVDEKSKSGGEGMKEFNSFGNYLKSLEKYEFLTAEEERKLIKKAQAGNSVARDKVICANLRFVVDQAKKMARKCGNADIEDLINAGNLGLVKAISKFDLSRNVRFITCAIFWIRAEMSDEIGASNPIRLPHNCMVKLPGIKALEKELPSGISENEKYDILAQRLGMTKKGVMAILASSRGISSLDAIESEEDDFNLYSSVSDNRYQDPADSLVKADAVDRLNEMVRTLPEDERKVIESHYGLRTGKGMSLEEIARTWDRDITREGIRQKELRAMRRFREEENMRYFDGMLDIAV